MKVTLIFPLTRENVLHHVDSLLDEIKELNKSNSELEIVQAVFSGEAINSKVRKNTLYIRYMNKNTQEHYSPAIVAKDLNIKEKVKFLENENKWFEINNLLKSNFINIKSIACLDIDENYEKGFNKIVFEKNMVPIPKLIYSLNITKDYAVQRLLSEKIANIKTNKLFK